MRLLRSRLQSAALSRELVHIMNDVPNHYVLIFTPHGPNGAPPHAGLHTLTLKLREHPELVLEARSSYWVDEGK